jgi:hypothetical protein
LGRIITGLISASSTIRRSTDANRESPTRASARLARSPLGRPRKPQTMASPLTSSIISNAPCRSMGAN